MPHRQHIDPNGTLRDLMETWPATIEVFLRHKMLCVGCLVTPFHTIADACAEYRLDPQAFKAELNAAIISEQLRGTPARGDAGRSR